MTHRFVVGKDLVLSADQARQIASVLRLGPGAEVVLLSDGDEVDYRLDAVSTLAASGTVLRRRHSDAEPRVRLVLALPLLRGEHSELVLESATQLGVARFVPFTSSRSVARELGVEKRRRWERIVREAVETSRRARVPEIAPVMRWEALFEELEGDTIVAWEEGAGRASATRCRAIPRRCHSSSAPRVGSPRKRSRSPSGTAQPWCRSGGVRCARRPRRSPPSRS